MYFLLNYLYLFYITQIGTILSFIQLIIWVKRNLEEISSFPPRTHTMTKFFKELIYNCERKIKRESLELFWRKCILGVNSTKWYLQLLDFAQIPIVSPANEQQI